MPIYEYVCHKCRRNMRFLVLSSAGAFRPDCPSWAIERLPFAIVAGACAHWVLGLSRGPSLRAVRVDPVTTLRCD